MNTDQEMATYLQSIGVIYTPIHCGLMKREDWKNGCDEWCVRFDRTINGNELTLASPFFCGVGHRKNGKPVAPSSATVLYSLFMDADDCNLPFDEWCDQCGYDTDSRKALGMYDQCRATRRQVLMFFSKTESCAIRTVLEGF